jgi:hypothetical protein
VGNTGVNANGVQFGVSAVGSTTGVYASGSTTGVSGTGYYGIYGNGNGSGNTGVTGIGNGSGSIGVYASGDIGIASSGVKYGVSASSAAIGVMGAAGNSSIKNNLPSTTSVGAVFNSGATIYLDQFLPGYNYGLYVAAGTQGDRIAGAAVFNGNVLVQGDFQATGTLSKGGGSFKIDHPLDPANKYFYHSFVEPPDMMNIYNGLVTLDSQGEATVTMPDWFAKPSTPTSATN